MSVFNSLNFNVPVCGKIKVFFFSHQDDIKSLNSDKSLKNLIPDKCFEMPIDKALNKNEVLSLLFHKNREKKTC